MSPEPPATSPEAAAPATEAAVSFEAAAGSETLASSQAAVSSETPASAEATASSEATTSAEARARAETTASSEAIASAETTATSKTAARSEAAAASEAVASSETAVSSAIATSDETSASAVPPGPAASLETTVGSEIAASANTAANFEAAPSSEAIASSEATTSALSPDPAARAYRLDVISLVPEAFAPLQGLGVIGRALRAGRAEVQLHNPRDYASDRYRKVDDVPYGGGAGMVLKPEPVYAAFEAIPVRPRRRVLLLTPQGRPLHQRDLQRWAREHDQLVLLCGHYEGFDERIRGLADEEVSLGDFVLTGGELPAMVIINGVVRLLPGTVGTAESLEHESHSDLLLEHPHYTRPAVFRGLEVPAVLRSGDHGAIARWRLEQQQQRTRERRPDLYTQWLERPTDADLKDLNWDRERC